MITTHPVSTGPAAVPSVALRLRRVRVCGVSPGRLKREARPGGPTRSGLLYALRASRTLGSPRADRPGGGGRGDPDADRSTGDGAGDASGHGSDLRSGLRPSDRGGNPPAQPVSQRLADVDSRGTLRVHEASEAKSSGRAKSPSRALLLSGTRISRQTDTPASRNQDLFISRWPDARVRLSRPASLQVTGLRGDFRTDYRRVRRSCGTRVAGRVVGPRVSQNLPRTPLLPLGADLGRPTTSTSLRVRAGTPSAVSGPRSRGKRGTRLTTRSRSRTPPTPVRDRGAATRSPSFQVRHAETGVVRDVG